MIPATSIYVYTAHGLLDKNRREAKTTTVTLAWKHDRWFISQVFFNTDLLAVVRQQIQCKKKKKITILALLLLAHNNPFSAGIFSNYSPVLLAPCNTYQHGAKA